MAEKTLARPAFGRRLRDLRRAARLSLRDLERLTGLSRGALSMLESGKREPYFSTVVRIAEAMGVSLLRFL